MPLLISGPMLQNNHFFSASQKGFSLLEVLIAISIFAMLSLTAYQVLQGVLRSGDISKKHSEALTELQRAMLIIEQDFRQIVARKSRDESSDADELRVISVAEGLFESTDQGIEFNRLGWQNPLNLLPRSNILRVRYRLYDGQLQRLYFLYPDLVSGQEPEVQVLLKNIETLSFHFWDTTQWADKWMEKNRLPNGIKISFRSKQFGEINRVFVISAGEISETSDEDNNG